MNSKWPHVSYHYTNRRGGYTLEDYMVAVKAARPADERTVNKYEPVSIGKCVFCDGEDPCCENCGGHGYA